MGQWFSDQVLAIVVGVVGTLFAVTLLAVSLGLGLGLGLEEECDCPTFNLDEQCPTVEEKQYINVGVLHSLSGALANSERPVVDATLLAIEEINSAGGVNGFLLNPVLRDGNSNEQVFATEMENLLSQEEVEVVFGCWTSASRKAVLPVLAEHDGLLFYPVQYEGVEEDPNVVYTGAAPNQQIIPALEWAYNVRSWRKFALVGSDYIFPRTANAIIKDVLNGLENVTYSESYLVLGDISAERIQTVVDFVKGEAPDVVLNTINGDTNINFFILLQGSGIPVISFSIAEPEIKGIGSDILQGSLAAWYFAFPSSLASLFYQHNSHSRFSSRNYFQSVPGSTNANFVGRFKSKYGSVSVVGDPMVAGYSGVHLWAGAAKAAGSFDKQDLLRSLKNSTRFNSPQGMLRVSKNQHTVKRWYLGETGINGQFNILQGGEEAIPPEPYPASRTKEQWEEFLSCWNEAWEGSWSNTKGPANILPNDHC
ncbi:Urea ABC transporter substrate-binding protein [Balamuthia mandrillaris]